MDLLVSVRKDELKRKATAASVERGNILLRVSLITTKKDQNFNLVEIFYEDASETSRAKYGPTPLCTPTFVQNLAPPTTPDIAVQEHWLT
jgi:hypothetical protein